MAIISFFFHLFGAVFLLLYAVRMVRTGIERAFGPSFKRIFTQSGGRLRSAITGLCFAVVLQSSAGVTLLAAGFAGTSLIPFTSAVAV
ncbi:MAG TPA: Na/Pi cotransporter family protein, partial [Hyphomicrobiaceae bacterium]|nr:Na/Pi cotransporter family protein [Hyphomicrobiaceae bacterium]